VLSENGKEVGGGCNKNGGLHGKKHGGQLAGDKRRCFSSCCLLPPALPAATCHACTAAAAGRRQTHGGGGSLGRRLQHPRCLEDANQARSHPVACSAAASRVACLAWEEGLGSTMHKMPAGRRARVQLDCMHATHRLGPDLRTAPCQVACLLPQLQPRLMT